MRVYEPPEKADILVSELLASFGDNELSPECLDGAQRFLKRSGISIPRPADKTLRTCYETPYIIHLVNYYQIAPAQALFKFEHPNWSDVINNERYKKLKFNCTQNRVLTGFVGFFDTVLYKDVMLSTHPETHTHEMVTWFPIVFPLQKPLKVQAGSVIEISFWRVENPDKVWYEWCLEAPMKGCIMNPNGRSYFIKKH
ncbi:PRMT5 domain containing protein [Asbolus verrucosus]|uniref:PRMT5 domain containing protein n=1 Tax=Asbolus verrucosus TaxID=1661398 RepID=A0A482V1L0_ASBVE|nr:PRMT5 domain containing protein [Asbolus verrucosus]